MQLVQPRGQIRPVALNDAVGHRIAAGHAGRGCAGAAKVAHDGLALGRAQQQLQRRNLLAAGRGRRAGNCAASADGRSGRQLLAADDGERRLAGNRLQIQRHLHGSLVIEDQPGNGPGSWPGNRGDGRGRPMNRRLVRDGLGGQARQRGAGCERYVRLGKVRRQRRRGA